jgi:hypothetical protein
VLQKRVNAKARAGLEEPQAHFAVLHDFLGA